ncbi:MAG: N-formylglutamate amidohydrolase [Rhodospirillales bacterium]
MPGHDRAQTTDGASWSVSAPAEQTVPLVFASPHSGRDYPGDFVAQSRLDPVSLRRSEDAFVDDIYAAAADHGAPLLRAHFPRVYIDPNREPYELDATMFEDPLPDYVNAISPRVAAGLGTIARVVTSGEEIYRGKLTFAVARQRIERHYFPYHEALRALIDATRQRFGACLLIDCHSMPSVGGPMDSDSGAKRVDIVLGDCQGSSCAGAVTDAAERVLRGLGFSVRRNVPYAGGYTTRHYGRPWNGVHALQIEINRALYMDERTITPTAGLVEVTRRIERLIEALAEIDASRLRAP